MLKIFTKPKYLLFVFIVLSFVVRIINFSFPAFTADEARIAYRASTLAYQGRDELGRSFPLLFNSTTDYQLPAVSYITAVGVFIFGKTDFGVRIPFIILGVFLVILIYKISKIYSDKKSFWFTSVLISVCSPVLIFISKVPNDSIVLVFLLTLLFYLLIRRKLNILLILSVMVLSLAVSKSAWFIMTPFVALTLFFYQKNLSKNTKIKLSFFGLFITCVVVGFYLHVPQSKRSLLENNFSLFSNITIKNGIDRSRGQGIESGWPNNLEVVVFNKSFFLTIGFIHWLSNLQSSIYFSQFDKSGQLGFSQMGMFEGILVVPFIAGLIYLVQKGSSKERLIFIYLLILTFPAIFFYPDISQNIVILTLPFVTLIISFGLTKFNSRLFLLIIVVMALELGLNLLYLTPERKNTNLLRPSWAKELTIDIYNQSIEEKVAVSDDIVTDVISFIEWYNHIKIKEVNAGVPYPYKFHQSEINNIKIIGSDSRLYSCKENIYGKVFISSRDKDGIKDLNLKVVKTYKDSLNKDRAYLLESNLCIK